MGKGRLESHVLVLVTLGLVAFGLVMVFSATSAAAAVGDGDPGYYLKRQGIYALAGLALMIVLSRVDFHALRSIAPALVLVSLFLCLAVLVVSEPVNGARRWLALGPATFQPSELAKLSLAVWAAAYLARRRPPQTLRELARPIGLLAGLFFLLILAEPDLGTVVSMALMLAAVLLVAGVPFRALASAGVVVAGVALAAIALEPYRRARFFSFLDPWTDPEGSGFQTVQAMIGLGSGGILGEGLGRSVQKIFYLPEAHTDMIFAIVGEELGLVGTAAVICAYAAFAYAGLRVALACRDPFGLELVGRRGLVRDDLRHDRAQPRHAPKRSRRIRNRCEVTHLLAHQRNRRPARPRPARLVDVTDHLRVEVAGRHLGVRLGADHDRRPVRTQPLDTISPASGVEVARQVRVLYRPREKIPSRRPRPRCLEHAERVGAEQLPRPPRPAPAELEPSLREQQQPDQHAGEHDPVLLVGLPDVALEVLADCLLFAAQ